MSPIDYKRLHLPSLPPFSPRSGPSTFSSCPSVRVRPSGQAGRGREEPAVDRGDHRHQMRWCGDRRSGRKDDEKVSRRRRFLGRERDGIRKLISLREKLSSFRSCRRHKFRNWPRSILRTGGRAGRAAADLATSGRCRKGGRALGQPARQPAL